jgi:group I intron endonuclease
MRSVINCGIYSITSPSGKKYVGSGQDIEKRWDWHRHKLRKGGHHSQALQRAWTKYGESTFLFEILELCNISSLNEREQHWIDMLKTVGPHGYNCQPTAGNARGFRHTEVSKQKMRDGRAKYLETPGAKESLSNQAHTQHSSGKLGRQTWSSETENVVSAKLKSAWTDPEKRAAHAQLLRERLIECNCRASRGER